MENIFCGNCGFQNSAANNFCNRCGEKLNLVKDESNNSKLIKLKNQNQKDLKGKLINLIKKSGYINIGCADNWIQVLKYKNKNEVYIAIVKEGLNKNEITSLKSNQFYLVEDNFIRMFKITTIKVIVDEVSNGIEYVFKNILSINENTPYQYEEYTNTDLRIKTDGSLTSNLTETKEEQERKTEFKGGIVLLILILLFVGVTYLYNNSKTSNDHTTSKSSENYGSVKSLKVEAFVASQGFVKENLKSAHTAEFPTIDYTCSINESDSSFKIDSYVDSQNSFGASVRIKYIALLKYTGGDPNDAGSWALKDIMFFNENGELIQ